MVMYLCVCRLMAQGYEAVQQFFLSAATVTGVFFLTDIFNLVPTFASKSVKSYSSAVHFRTMFLSFLLSQRQINFISWQCKCQNFTCSSTNHVRCWILFFFPTHLVIFLKGSWQLWQKLSGGKWRIRVAGEPILSSTDRLVDLRCSSTRQGL